jgi:hypothetical protein
MTDLVSALQRCTAAGTARHLHRELCNHASLYVLSRERFLLPTWARSGGDAERLPAYAGFKHALADLVVTPPGRPSFRLCLTAFAGAIALQQVEDRQVLLPALREGLDLADRRNVFNEMELFYLADDRAGRGLAPRPQSLVDEAEVVLSSLGGTSPQRSRAPASPGRVDDPVEPAG